MSVLSNLFSKLLSSSGDDVASRVASQYTDDAIKQASKGFAKDIGSVPLSKAGKNLDLSTVTYEVPHSNVQQNLADALDQMQSNGWSNKNIKGFRNQMLVDTGNADALDYSKLSDRNLIATHQITPEKLSSAAELGGFVQPSMAIVNPNLEGNFMPSSDFGDIVLVANRRTVDPSMTDTIIGNRDIYSPRVPRSDVVDGERVFIDGNGNTQPFTAESANRIMNNNSTVGSEDFYSSGSPSMPPYLSNTGRYRNLDSVNKNSYRLVTRDDGQAIKNALDDRAFAVDSQIRSADSNIDPTMSSQNIDNLLRDANLPDDVRADIADLQRAYQELPVSYFEAKPRRVVNGDEFYGAYIPSDAGQDVIDNLNRLGVTNINTYDRATGVQPQLRELAQSGRRFVNPYILGIGGLGVLTGLLGGNSNADSSYA